MHKPGEITVLLHAARDGDRAAFDRLVPMVYGELSRIARSHLARSRRDQILDTTALVHEAYMKMAKQAGFDVNDRAHFLAVAARAMRQVIIQFVRARKASKRGGGEVDVTLDDHHLGIDARADRVLEINRALERLHKMDERMARIVECRFFAGMSEAETAEAVGVSLRTVQRDWLRARAWLRDELSEDGEGR